MKLLHKLAGVFLLSCVLCAARAATPAGFDATFVQTRSLPGFSASLVSHGIMRFDQVHGFHWEITAPYHYVFEMNGEHAQERLPDGSVRQLNPDQTPWLAAVQHIFVSALSGNRSDLKRYFSVAVAPLAKGQRVTLTPKPGAIANAILNIQVTETAPGHPRLLVIREISGGHMEIRFTPATHPAPAS